MPTVNVKNQVGTAIDGAFIQVYSPSLLWVLGGYNATATTDGNGNATFPQADILSLPEGSSADVIVNYTDPATGTKYAAEGNWGVGFFGFSPDPLNIQLIENLSINNEGGGGFDSGQLVEVLEIAGVGFVVVLFAIIGYTVAKDVGVFKPDYSKTEP